MMMSSLKNYRSKQRQYIVRESIGRGSFGEVEKCQHIESGKIYAIKIIPVNRLDIDIIQQQAKNMAQLSSQYVLQLIESFYDESLGSYVLVTPYYKSGSFENMMSHKWQFQELLLFFYQISKALYQLSKKKILHLDLKPQNILMQSPYQYVVCDLGCSRIIENKANMNQSYNMLKVSGNPNKGVGTPQYASPDLILNGEMTDFSDIWSLGVILYKIIFKKHPLSIFRSKYTQNMIGLKEGTFSIDFTQTPESKPFSQIIDILKRMLVCSRNKQQRIVWKDIIEKLYVLAQIPVAQRPYIITNFGNFLKFVDNISIIISALLHYIDESAQFLTSKMIDTKNFTKEICVYLLTITRELITHTKQIKQDFWQYFVFETTRKQLTKKQKSFAQFLEKQALRLAADRNILIQYENLLISWERVKNGCAKLFKSLKGQSSSKVIMEINIKKIQEITEFIGFYNLLQYQKKKELDLFVKNLIKS